MIRVGNRKKVKRPSWKYKIGEIITKSNEEKKLGLMIQDTPSLERHINGIFGSTYILLTNINVVFNYLERNDEKDFNKYDML